MLLIPCRKSLLIFRLLVVMVFTTTFYSCDKDVLDLATTPDYQPAPVYVFSTSDLAAGAKSASGLRQTQLGVDRENPFTVKALETASASLYGSAAKREPTDYYIKFMPSGPEDLLALENADLFLLDFPWTKEIVSAGDYYYSSPDSTAYPDLYTTIAVGAPIPNVNHVVLASLDMSESDPIILNESFDLTGNGAEFAETYLKNGMPTKICIAIEKSEDCHDVGPGAGGGNPFVLNECGCLISTNQRRPGGCVQVFDSEFQDFEAVRRVTVYAKNGWFTWRRANTDDNGCWRIDKSFFGKAWFWVKFKDRQSNRTRLRLSGVRGWRFWQKAFTAKYYVGRLKGPTFNNINVQFDRWTDTLNMGSKVHYGFAAATINNTVHEIHDFAAAENITLPPPNLNILVRLRKRNGYAIMLRQIGCTEVLSAAALGTTFWPPNALDIGNELDEVSEALVEVTGISVPEVYQQCSPLLKLFAGDIGIGGRFVNSDLQKRLAYHELAHASHFANTSPNYWRGLIAATVGALGHGEPTDALAGHIQVAESWAEHVALDMNSARYGAFRRSERLRLSTTWVRTWGQWQERVRNESMDHVPIGIYRDLMDDINLSETVRDEEDLTIANLIDPVNGGYTNAIFDDIYT